jgi:hypothetical protein
MANVVRQYPQDANDQRSPPAADVRQRPLQSSGASPPDPLSMPRIAHSAAGVECPGSFR